MSAAEHAPAPDINLYEPSAELQQRAMQYAATFEGEIPLSKQGFLFFLESAFMAGHRSREDRSGNSHDALVEERAGMIANAERFEFLRDWSTGRERLKILMQSVCAEEFDAAIDREIAAGKAATARYIAEQAAKGGT